VYKVTRRQQGRFGSSNPRAASRRRSLVPLSDPLGDFAPADPRPFRKAAQGALDLEHARGFGLRIFSISGRNIRTPSVGATHVRRTGNLDLTERTPPRDSCRRKKMGFAPASRSGSIKCKQPPGGKKKRKATPPSDSRVLRVTHGPAEVIQINSRRGKMLDMQQLRPCRAR